MEVLKQDCWKEAVTEYERKFVAVKNRFHIRTVIIFSNVSYLLEYKKNFPILIVHLSIYRKHVIQEQPTLEDSAFLPPIESVNV